MFIRILFDFNTFSPYRNDLQAFLFSQGGIFSESWLDKNKTIMSENRHVNGKVSAKLAIRNSTLSC